MSSLVDAIFYSSDYSSDNATCIEFIRKDLRDELKPVADAMRDHPEAVESLKAVFVDTTVAARIHRAIWPKGDKGAIYTELQRVLEPIAKSLEKAGCDVTVAVLRRHYAGGTEYAAAIKVDPNARPLRSSSE